MGFRNTLIFAGLVLLATSFFIGDLFIWLGAPLLFLGVSLRFLDVS